MNGADSARPMLVGGVVCAAASAGLIERLYHGGRWSGTPALMTAVGVFAVVAWWLLRQPSTGRGLGLVILCAALCQLTGLVTAPISSTDAYRYVWDGRVSLSGNSPYSKVPLDDDLAPLRDPVLFPGLAPTDRAGVTGRPHLPRDPQELAGYAADDPRTRINRPKVPTIYPPIAQVYFAAVAAVTPWSAGTLGIQVAAALLAVALTALIGVHLRRTGRDPRLALLWGWCPIVTVEAANSAHVDVLAALLIAGAVVSTRRSVAGLMLGCAAGVKLVPLLLLPAFTTVRRRVVGLVAVGVLTASYLPYVVVTGDKVLGFLPGYLTAEGFADGGTRYAVIGLLVPPPVRTLVALVVAIGLAIVALRQRGEIAVTCCWLLASALLIATPTYPWYGLPLIALAVLAGRLEWLAVPIAAYVAYANLEHSGWIYLAATVFVLAATLARRPGNSVLLPTMHPEAHVRL